MIDKFDTKTAEKLGHYVYRLIDPRNGQTFYVGMGQENRVFDHVKGVEGKADLNDAKNKRIKEVIDERHEVELIIHRHGLLDKDTALEVEAALIDAYPEALNENSGHDAGRGIMTIQEVINKYQPEEIREEDMKKYNLLALNVSRTVDAKGVRKAVRYAWGVDPEKAKRADYVLAEVEDFVKGVFIVEPDDWMPATVENFPDEKGEPDKWGFIKEKEAPQQIAELFLGKKLPKRKKGHISSFRYFPN